MDVQKKAVPKKKPRLCKSGQGKAEAAYKAMQRRGHACKGGRLEETKRRAREADSQIARKAGQGHT